MKAKLNSKNIHEIVASHSSGFNEKQSKNVISILRNIYPKLSGKFFSCGSGGGHTHMFFQFKNFRWVGFHSVTGDITISSPYKTGGTLYRAFWYNPDKATGAGIASRADSNETFSHVKIISNDIRKNKFVVL